MSDLLSKQHHLKVGMNRRSNQRGNKKKLSDAMKSAQRPLTQNAAPSPSKLKIERSLTNAVSTQMAKSPYLPKSAEAARSARTSHSSRQSPVKRPSEEDTLSNDSEPEPIDEDEQEKRHHRFHHGVRIVQILLRMIRMNRNQKDVKNLSFFQLQEQLVKKPARPDTEDPMDFDPTYYKRPKELSLSQEVKTILAIQPHFRTEEQIQIALRALSHTVEAFCEFPIKMQRELASRAYYEQFESRRVIIRQGHSAENFYLILSGTAVVTKLMRNPQTGEESAETVALLKRGNSFGELALMYGGARSATVACQTDMALLAVPRSDFIDIFMHIEKGKVPDHIQFLYSVELMNHWRIDALPYDDPKTCLFTFFRRNLVMCRDSNNAEWIYIVKTGSCRVLKSLNQTEPRIQKLANGRVKLHDTAFDIPKLMVRSNTIDCIESKFKRTSYRSFPTPTLEEKKCAQEEIKHQRRRLNSTQLFKTQTESPDPSPQHSRMDRKPKAQKQPRKLFIQVQTLGPGDTFGLVDIAFGSIEGATSVTLVSDGAECILINLKFFKKHLSQDIRKVYRRLISPYPTEEELQSKLQFQSDWEVYKALVLEQTTGQHDRFLDTLHY